MATSTIKNPGNFRTISTWQYYLVKQADTWEYTGLSVTIPPHTAYGIMGSCIFANSRSINAVFSSSSEMLAPSNIAAIAGSDDETACNVFVTGYNPDEVSYTYYLWGKWVATTSNDVKIQGWLYTPNQD